MVRVIYCHRSKVVDSDGGARLVERMEIADPGDLPTEVVALTKQRRCSWQFQLL